MVPVITNLKDDMSIDHAAIRANVRDVVDRGIQTGRGVLLAVGVRVRRGRLSRLELGGIILEFSSNSNNSNRRRLRSREGMRSGDSRSLFQFSFYRSSFLVSLFTVPETIVRF